MRLKAIIISICFLLPVLIASAQPFRQPEVLDRITVGRGDLSVVITATGTVLPERQVGLVFEGTGIVAEIFVRQGDSVPAGTPLARLDAPDLERAVRQAEIAVELQQVALEALTAPARPEDLAVAQAAVDAARAQLNAAFAAVPANQADIAALQAELARNQLWQAQLQRDLAQTASGAAGFSINLGGLIPDQLADDIDPALIEQANAALSQALSSTFTLPAPAGLPAGGNQTALTQAEFGVQIAEAQAAAAASAGPNAGTIAQANAAIAAAQAQLDRLLNGPSALDVRLAQLSVQQAQLALEQARAALARMMLVAPFEGTVARLNLRVGEAPPTQTPAILFVDLSQLHVDLAVDETDVVRIAPGQSVTLRLDALPDAAIRGTVTRIAAVPTVVGQLVTYPVEVTIDPGDQPVRIGMSATATITVRELSGIIVLPNRFIRIDRDTGQASVVVETAPGNFQEVQVTLGERGEIESEIASGLSDGDVVVLLPRGTFDPFTGPPGG
ncbi:MAG: efflux RND transporter periplasmic adaptor subunit [Candidatus Flexifilum sp.]